MAISSIDFLERVRNINPDSFERSEDLAEVLYELGCQAREMESHHLSGSVYAEASKAYEDARNSLPNELKKRVPIL